MPPKLKLDVKKLEAERLTGNFVINIEFKERNFV